MLKAKIIRGDSKLKVQRHDMLMVWVFFVFGLFFPLYLQVCKSDGACESRCELSYWPHERFSAGVKTGFDA